MMQQANSSTNISQLTENYDQWAEDYDKDLKEKLAYKVPEIAVAFFESFLLENDKILDVGCGTGLVGELLFTKNFRCLEALDLSKKMLEVAKRKGIYQEFHIACLGNKLALPSNFYNALIAVGTFGPTHAPPSAFKELIRICKPEGYFSFTMRENEIPAGSAFLTQMKRLEQEGKWLLVKESNRFQGFPVSKPDLFFKNFIYKII